MNHRFFTKIKEVSVKDLIHILLFLFALIPAFIYKRIRPNLWLVCENRFEARDNGYWLYKYIRENHKDCDVVYAIDPTSPDFERVKNLGPTITYGTFIHWIYYLAAKINISSQKGGKPNAAVCYILEVYGIRKNIRVFLQHGVIKDDARFVHYENSKFSMFVTSTQREYEYVRDTFNYPGEEVKLLGLCRFDRLFREIDLEKNKVKPLKTILVMPTWRGWISPPSSGKGKYDSIEKFKTSEYYKCWNAILSDEKIGLMLEEHSAQIVFYMHREMSGFNGSFHSVNSHVIIVETGQADVQDLLIGADYLVTDYSSVAFDFAYMDKPLCYYQFDYEKYSKEHYDKGYFEYGVDGFGPVCDTLDGVRKALMEFLSDSDSMEMEYAKRRKDFFTLRDGDNCKRNYEAIKVLAEGIS